MKNYILAAVLAFSVMGCGQSDTPVKFQNPRTEIQLNIMHFDTKSEMQKYLSDNAIASDVKRSGLARWYENDPTNECTIFILPPQKSSEADYGHELWHCIYGNFHEEI